MPGSGRTKMCGRDTHEKITLSSMITIKPFLLRENLCFQVKRVNTPSGESQGSQGIENMGVPLTSHR